MTLYERFEQVVAIVLSLVIAAAVAEQVIPRHSLTSLDYA